MKASEIKQRLESGDTLLLVDTGARMGYQNHFRFLSDGKTANVRGLQSLKKKGHDIPYIRVPRHVATMKDEWNSYALEEIRHWCDELLGRKIAEKRF